MTMTASASRSRRHARSRNHKPALLLGALALFAPFVDLSRPSRWRPSPGTFAAAQNVVGKFAARAKPEAEGAKKKNKWRFGRDRRGEARADDACESTPVEHRMMLLSFVASVLCAALSWRWYARPDGNVERRAVAGAEGALVRDDEERLHAGLFQSAEVGFEDVGMTLQRKKQTDRVILDGSLRGVAKPGRMLAIMGPSGSGKTTLLHAIAGKVKGDKKISLSGNRYVNNIPISGDSHIPSAFVQQEVSFFPHMTVRETLTFQVELKMGATLKKKAEREGLVRDLMQQLGLTKSADTIVGNAKVRGLSGGERKRLSIACEMIASPPVVFLDEPTSGLDSFQATQVIETLRGLANQGKTIVAVIHQPSQHIFQLFDDLLLVSEGRQMYFGEVAHVRGHLEGLGYACAPEVGTAEHALDCISGAAGADAAESRAATERLDRIAAAAAEQARAAAAAFRADDARAGAAGDASSREVRLALTAAHPGTNVWRQFRLLAVRSARDLLRGKTAILIKITQQVSLGVIYGGIYTLGDDQVSIMDRFGLLSLIVIGATNMAMAGTVRSFPKEKAIVSTEMASGMYRTGPYLISKAISEIPFIGLFNGIFATIVYPLVRLQKGKFCNFLGLTSLHSIASVSLGLLIGSVSSSSDTALALFPPIIILNIIFDGKNISEETTPALLKWVNKIGLIRWGFTGLALNEFEGLDFTSSGPFRGPVAKTGEEALARFGLDGGSLENVIGAQTKIIVGCWLLSFAGLSLTRQKFEVMKNSLD